MNSKWQNATQTIQFRGEKEVIHAIIHDQNKPKTLWQKINDLLNYELLIPTKGLIATCTVFALAVGIRATYFTPQMHTYSITVINERGYHEKTY